MVMARLGEPPWVGEPPRSAEVEETFVQRMGLDWTQAAALMGVHTLGRAQAGPDTKWLEDATGGWAVA